MSQSDRPLWTTGAIAQALHLPPASTRVWCSRKTKRGELLRLKRDLYVLPAVFDQFGEEKMLKLANLLQTPSYISCLSSLSFHQLTTQLPVSRIESMNPVRSRTYQIKDWLFRYYYCQPSYYFGFTRQQGLFVASPEKALLDALYLLCFGRYALDASALNLGKIDWPLLEKYSKKYPARTQKFIKKWRENR